MAQNDFMGNWDGLLDQVGITDPVARQQWQMLAGMMNANQSEAEAADKETERRREQARKKLQRLVREHEMLLARNEALAAALGACPDCWGEFRACQTCRGQGRPGCFAPDKEAFNEYVLPVLERLGLIRAGTAQSKPQKEG